MTRHPDATVRPIVTPRLRGRAGQRQRQRRLYAEPLCRDCKAKGIITAAIEVDHIVALAPQFGGTDTDDNCRALCSACHQDRTREVFGHRKRVRIAADGWPEE